VKIRITGSTGQIYTIAVQDIVKTWLKISFWISPLAVWKIYDLIEPYIK
jgi:hypothetical protein